MIYMPDPNVPTDLVTRQKMADQNSAPHREEKIIWRNGVGLPESYVRSLPEGLRPDDVNVGTANAKFE